MLRCLLAAHLSMLSYASGRDLAFHEDTCKGDAQSTSFLQSEASIRIHRSVSTDNAYHWPSARGAVGSYGSSKFDVPRNISKPTWSWQSTKGRWADIPIGTCIDDRRDIYLTLADGLSKFSPDGKLLWEYTRRFPEEQISDGSSLWRGAVYSLTTKARVFALSMETGKELWSTVIGASKSLNLGQAAAHDGVVIVASQSGQTRPYEFNLFLATAGGSGAADDTITGLSALNGSILWTFTPTRPVWNFAASFAGDGTFVFQDLSGTAYRHSVHNGSLIWKAGGNSGSWTDGHSTIGPNGIVYSVANYLLGFPFAILNVAEGGAAGVLSAFSLADGKLLWSQKTAKSPNDVPVVGRLHGRTGYSVVIPAGQQTIQGQQIVVYAFDASTGEPQWTFWGPSQVGPEVAGDAEGADARIANGIRDRTAPNPWGQAAIDNNGTVFVGGETGHFFSLQDADGDGHVNAQDINEVSVFETGAAFVGSSGPAIAPGLLAAAAQDRLHVWQW